MSSTTIPFAVGRCFSAFDNLCENLAPEAGRPASTFGLAVREEYGRFKAWTGSVCAHLPGTSSRSLQFRLRDSSDLRETVGRLLKDLSEALRGLDHTEYVSSDSHLLRPVAEAIHDSQGQCTDELGDIEMEAADVGSMAEDFDMEEPEMEAEDEHQQLLEDVHDVVDCLMRVLPTLRNPAGLDHMRYFATSGPLHHTADVEYVQARHPEAPEYLVQRIGKLLTRHRLYFRYRELHNTELTDDVSTGKDPRGDLRQGQATNTAKFAYEDIHNEPQVYEADDGSWNTATSNTGVVRPVPMPVGGISGEPFECPLCFTRVIASDELVWRAHVYEDMPPYVCTQELCPTADQPFTKWRDWQQHEIMVHYRTWICPFGCPDVLESAQVFQVHVTQHHGPKLGNLDIQQMIDACGLPSEIDQVTSRCPLCQKMLTAPEQFFKHLGHHLEELTLFSLPETLSQQTAGVPVDQEVGLDEGAKRHYGATVDDEGATTQSERTVQNLAAAEDTSAQGAGSAQQPKQRGNDNNYVARQPDKRRTYVKGDKVWLNYQDGTGPYPVEIEQAQVVAGIKPTMKYRLSYKGQVVDYEGNEWFPQELVSMY
ncbi:hypothetical protein LTR17_025969 [Elasticomyces elasticus]|nr:hypothetical protein LTR17_025969 [Elasticomyces elasticus]